MKTTVMMVMMVATTPRGWRLVSTKSLRALHRPTLTSLGWEPLRGRRAGLATANRGSPHQTVLTPTPLQCLRRVGPFLAPNLLLRLGRATGLRLWLRGH